MLDLYELKQFAAFVKSSGGISSFNPVHHPFHAESGGKLRGKIIFKGKESD